MNKDMQKAPKSTSTVETVPLNKYLSRAGICSRRNAAQLVKAGHVIVNGKMAANPGIRITQGDSVMYQGKKVNPESFVYLMLNKPSKVITAVSDPEGRPTVMAFLPPSIRQRVYPVGRLDKETTGLLILTNDGDLAMRLAHPKFGVRKVYQVHIDRPVDFSHMERMKHGVMLEDGMARVDSIAYASQDKRSVRVIIHDGKKRIVRRLFEMCGYIVKKLDRARYGGLTKRGLGVGDWRYLTKQEVALLKKEKNNTQVHQ